MTKRKITPSMLRKAGACDTGLKHFIRLFPKGVVPSLTRCEAHAFAFHWTWAACHLLSDDAFKVYYRLANRALMRRGNIASTAIVHGDQWDSYLTGTGSFIRKAAYEFCKVELARAFYAGWAYDERHMPRKKAKVGKRTQGA